MIHAALAAAAVVACSTASSPEAPPDDPVGPTLRTCWAADVDPDHPLPEHPRPLLVREAWQTLNGRWDYAITSSGEEAPLDPSTGLPLPEAWNLSAVTVPFPIESTLSGVARSLTPDQTLWYRRTFDAAELLGPGFAARTSDPQAPRLVLNFGAVDHHATVYLNRHRVGEHTGGYAPFVFELNRHLAPDDPQELIVAVTDPTDTSFQPRGKQTLSPHGIWYTAVSGIWQTVWLEARPSAYLVEPTYAVDLQAGAITITQGAWAEPTDTVHFTVVADGRPVAVASGHPAQPVVLRLPNPRRWSPADPFLYTLEIELIREGRAIDTATSYFALRTVELRTAPDGFPRLHLNGEPIFLVGLLDQGWWPDGLYTAPTDEALRSDIEQTLAMGFNTARKHVKVEPQRWYYWADRLGLLVLQDMPSGDGFIGPGDPDLIRSEESERAFRLEYNAMVSARRNHPSIIAWIPFNEGWGQFKTNQILDWAANRDPSRLIGGPSGWTDRGQGHLIDAHVYPGPGMLPPQLPDPSTSTPPRASFLGEFGGLGLALPGHLWKSDGSWGYRSLPDAATLERDYATLIERLRPLQARGLAGAIYTQTTDVEIEVNGLLTYDRIPKIPVERLAAINARAFLQPPTIIEIAATSEAAPVRWRYTTSDPGHGWHEPAFEDSSWPIGEGGFGTIGTPGAMVRTEWSSSGIWLRRTFDTPVIPERPVLHTGMFIPEPVETYHLRLHHDEDVEVYLNGALIHSALGYQTGYIDIPLADAALAALRPTGNTLALRCAQSRGGQYIDAGIILTIDAAPPP